MHHIPYNELVVEIKVVELLYGIMARYMEYIMCLNNFC